MKKETRQLITISMSANDREAMEIYIAKLRTSGRKYNNSSFIVKLVQKELQLEELLKEDIINEK